MAAQDETAPSAQPPPHTQPWPSLASGENQQEIAASIELGPELERGVPVREMLHQQERLNASLSSLKPHRRGVVDAYVLSIALDSDPVFAREAREAGLVLSKRYGAEGRTITLAGPDGRRDDLPRGSLRALKLALAQISALMDGDEDVLVLYTTSHGIPQGLAYHYGDTGYGILSPKGLREVLADLGIERRILILSACYSGVFVPELASTDTAILTASANNRTSFGCSAENDWTFFGDALINHALRQPQSLEAAAAEASFSIAGWEARSRVPASLPQTVIGENVSQWISALDARMPKVASAPVGRPSIGDVAANPR